MRSGVKRLKERSQGLALGKRENKQWHRCLTIRAIGVDDHCITRWIGLGYLQAKRRGTDRTPQQGGDIWYIKDRWVRDFVVDHVNEIDIRKVDKYWFVDLLAAGRAAGADAP